MRLLLLEWQLLSRLCEKKKRNEFICDFVRVLKILVIPADIQAAHCTECRYFGTSEPCLGRRSHT